MRFRSATLKLSNLLPFSTFFEFSQKVVLAKFDVPTNRRRFSRRGVLFLEFGALHRGLAHARACVEASTGEHHVNARSFEQDPPPLRRKASSARRMERRLLRHVPGGSDFESHTNAHAATYEFVPFHSFRDGPGPRAPVTSLGESQGGGGSASTRNHASADAGISGVSVFLFIFLPVAFAIHCCCFKSWPDTPDASLHALSANRRRRRGGVRRVPRVHPDGSPGTPEASTSGDQTSDFFDLEHALTYDSTGATRGGGDDSTAPELKPCSSTTIASLPWCVAGDTRWGFIFPTDATDTGDKKYKKDTAESPRVECVVCCDEIFFKQEVRVLQCAHVFHTGCIRNWLKVSPSCPACRHRVKRLTFEEREEFWRELGEGAELELTPPTPPPPPPPSAEGSGNEGEKGNDPAPVSDQPPGCVDGV